MENYQPIFNIIPESTKLLFEIAQNLERINIIAERVLTPKLRRENRIKSIRSSLYIEANTLTLEQVANIIDGKKVIGPKRDIEEVKGAKKAYDHILECNPLSIQDLLREHKYMMGRVMKNAGHFRTKGVAVFAGNTPIHVAPPAETVPALMGQLLDWYKNAPLPLIYKSCIFHYEFEFIHPFPDGNGRTGRLWHTLLLHQENSIFGWLPIETIIAANQEAYYRAIQDSTKNNDSGIFAEFMLKVIAKAVADFRTEHEGTNDAHLTDDEKQVLEIIKKNPSASYSEISAKLNKTEKTVGRILASLKDREIISRIGSNKTGSWVINQIED